MRWCALNLRRVPKPFMARILTSSKLRRGNIPAHSNNCGVFKCNPNSRYSASAPLKRGEKVHLAQTEGMTKNPRRPKSAAALYCI